MRCLQCGHSNPDSNKFCGECGTRLQREAVANNSAPVRNLEELELRDTQRERVRDSAASAAKTEPVILSSVIVKTDFPPATPEEEAEEEKATVTADASEGRPIRVGISGPSILGLGYETAANPKGFVYDKPRNDGFIYDTDGSSPEYLLEEEPGRSVSWRAWALLAVLVIAGGLGYLQWRANRGEGPDLMSMVRSYTGRASTNSSAKSSPAASSPASPNNATTAPANSTNAQAPPNAASTEQPPPPAAEPTNSAAAQNPGTPAASASPEAPAASQSSSNLSSDSEGDAPDASSSAPQATPKQQSAATPAPPSAQATAQSTEEDQSAKPSAQDDEDAKPEVNKSEAKSAPAKAAASPAKAVVAAKPKPLGDKDPLIMQAENYIQGRGRPKNCSAAVNLLRQSVSQGNPAADVKLGALYWSGTCVTQNKITAYRWFTRAHELEPTNRWVERSRNSMWASMSEQEKRLATSD